MTKFEWTELEFGKYEGRTLSWVLFADPDYYFWAREEGVFPSWMTNEVETIYERSRAIRVPRIHPEGSCVEYELDLRSMTFLTFELVPQDPPPPDGAVPRFQSRVIDMQWPRMWRHYDKGAYKRFLRTLRYYLFGNSSYRMTRKRAEAFFSDPKNFDC